VIEKAGTPPLERKQMLMAWTTPILIEIRIGLEINGYLPAEF
jgi:coenzyme PQQ precursor peptide PqqA